MMGTTLSSSWFRSTLNSVCRAAWNSFVGLMVAFAESAALAPWRANNSCNSASSGSTAASGITSPLIFNSKDCLKYRAACSPASRPMAGSSLVPR